MSSWPSTLILDDDDWGSLGYLMGISPSVPSTTLPSPTSSSGEYNVFSSLGLGSVIARGGVSSMCCGSNLQVPRCAWVKL